MDVGRHLRRPLWGFEEREKLMIFYEACLRARLPCGLFPARRVHPGLAE